MNNLKEVNSRMNAILDIANEELKKKLLERVNDRGFWEFYNFQLKLA